MEIIIIRKKIISMSIISTSLIVREQPSPRLHAEAWLYFRTEREMDYQNHFVKSFKWILTLLGACCKIKNALENKVCILF